MPLHQQLTRNFESLVNRGLATFRSSREFTVSEPAFVGIVKAQGVRRIFLFSFPALDAKAKFPRRVSGLEVVVAPGRLTVKAGRSSYASITILHGMFCKYCALSRKNPALFRKPSHFAVYTILFHPSSILLRSFIKALSIGFQSAAIR